VPIVAIFSAVAPTGAEVARRVAAQLGFSTLDDEALIERAAAAGDLSAEKLRRAMLGSPSVFNKFTHEKERGIARLRAALADLLRPDELVYHGYGTHLVPRSVTHVLKVGVASSLEARAAEVTRDQECSAKAARRQAEQEDAAAREWTRYLFELGPWDRSLYDVFLPAPPMTQDEAVASICTAAANPAVQRTLETDRIMDDFALAGRVNIVLAENGHDVEVACAAGRVTIVINRYVLRLDHLEQELRSLAGAVPGVLEVTTRVGPKFHQPTIYFDLDDEMPSKILLVDDEKDFVHTLSERLQTRNLGSAIAYNGEEALAIIESDEPEVVVLDLQMPGIQGIEVLRRVKKGHPRTEVIILTGHGSDKEAEVAAELGAFAYLRKPVDIKVLSEKMREAYAKLRAARGGGGDPQAPGSRDRSTAPRRRGNDTGGT